MGNWWHKKEAPLLGLGGLWGGTFSSLSGAAAEEAGLATWSFPGPTPSVTNGKYTFYTFTSSTNFSLPTAAPEVAFDDDGVPGNYISAVLVGGGGGGGGTNNPGNGDQGGGASPDGSGGAGGPATPSAGPGRYGSNGVTNRGGGAGGGASGPAPDNSNGGAGGKGVVIIRYKYQN